MKYLLDTHILLWVLEGNRKKLGSFLEVIENKQNYIAISVVNYWEIVIKQSLAKLQAPPLGELIEAVTQSGFVCLDLNIEHIKQLSQLPVFHHDPFDRLLIAQALTDQMHLLTVDQMVLKYF